jgi:hypothetical protein
VLQTVGFKATQLLYCFKKDEFGEKTSIITPFYSDLKRQNCFITSKGKFPTKKNVIYWRVESGKIAS